MQEKPIHENTDPEYEVEVESLIHRLNETLRRLLSGGPKNEQEIRQVSRRIKDLLQSVDEDE